MFGRYIWYQKYSRAASRSHLSLPVMNASTSSTNVLALYRALLRAVRHYPSKKRESIAHAIKQEFREKRSITGQELEKALWLANMELQRLQKWVPTSKQMAQGLLDLHMITPAENPLTATQQQAFSLVANLHS